jgi:peptide/nickel transport system substrate-binding protein
MRSLMRSKATWWCLMLLILASLLVMSCSTASPSPSPAPASTAPKPSAAAPAASSSAPAAPSASVAPSTSAAASPAAAKSDKSGGTLKYAIEASLVGNLGYMPELGNAAGVHMQAVFERLMLMKMDGAMVPELATSWKVADDRKSITINLRKGVKFHDGSDFTAEVCKWNLDLQMAAKKPDVKDWTSIDIVDPSTIRINLASYANTLFSALSKETITGMMSKAAFDKSGLDWVRAHPVGTGPFTFVEYIRDGKLTLKKNPNYWDAGKPYLDAVEISIITDDTVRNLAFQRNDIIYYSPKTPSIAKEMEKSGKYNIVLRTSGPRVLAPDSMNPKSPWADIKVRQAASYALDRELLASALGAGHCTPPYQLMQSQKDVVIADLVPMKYNPDKAKQLLTEAGYPNGFKASLTGRPLIITDDQVNAVAAMLRKVGIDITVNTVTAAKYDSMRIGGTWEGALAESMLVQANKNDTFVTYFTGLQWQYTKKPAGFQEALNASLTKLNIDSAAIKNVIKVLYDDMTVIPFYEEDTVSFENKGFHQDYIEMDFNGVDNFRFADIWLEKNLR